MLIEIFSGDYLNAAQVQAYEFRQIDRGDLTELCASGKLVAIFDTRELAQEGMARIAKLLTRKKLPMITQGDIHGAGNKMIADACMESLRRTAQVLRDIPKVATGADAPPLKYRLGWKNAREEQQYDNPRFDADFDTVQERKEWVRDFNSTTLGLHVCRVYLVEQDGSLTLMEE